MRHRFVSAAAIGLGMALLASCAQTEDESEGTPTAEQNDESASSVESEGAEEQQFPDVLEAELESNDDEFMIAVTLSSPYDTPERYADGWQVLTPDGEVLTEHDLAHDHENEQPFTRTRGPFTIPEGVSEVQVEGRDQANGYGGETVTITVPR